MAKMTRIKYSEYKKLKDVLAKEGFAAASKTARVVLEAFLYEDGRITSEWFVREKLCAKGQFTELRGRLIKRNWLKFREDTKRYLPGTRLHPYLKELESSRFVTVAQFRDLEQNTSADRTELHRVVDDVQDLKAQMYEVKALLAELKRLQAPPPSLEAQIKSAEITERLGRILTRN